MFVTRALRLAAAALAFFTVAGAASGQGLSPLKKAGSTPTDRKAFYVNVSNPYKRPMRFLLEVKEPDFETPAERAWVFPREFPIAPTKGRRVTLIMEIKNDQPERTVSLCVTAPDLKSVVLPRVCGIYVGRRFIQR